jgi:hypothetical protein
MSGIKPAGGILVKLEAHLVHSSDDEELAQ